MKVINWILIRSKDRGTEYGVGTFITQLSDYLSVQNDIDVFIIDVGNETVNEFIIEQRMEVCIFKFPKSNY